MPSLTCKNGCLSMSCAVILFSVSYLRHPFKNDRNLSESWSWAARSAGKKTAMGSLLDDRGTDRNTSEAGRLLELS